MDKYLVKYLRENAENEIAKKYIDFFKIELDWHIYNSEFQKSIQNETYVDLKRKLYKLFQYSNTLLSGFDKKANKNLNILSSVAFPDGLLNNLGYNFFKPIWNSHIKTNVFEDFKTINWYHNVRKKINSKNFNELLDVEWYHNLHEFQNHLVSEYSKKDFRALFLGTDQIFYSKYCIEVFNKMQRPTFVFSHGLPGIYSKEVDNRSDYLMVWGEKIRENYIEAGFDSSKIKVVGHPKYKDIPKNKTLRSDLSDVLVIPVSSVTPHQHEYDSIVLSNPSMVVLYLYKVQAVLKKLGIKKARYRVHPSIDSNWIYSFLDKNFYIKDSAYLTISLNKASLVIGSTSTVLLESLMQGVNYLVFEPHDDEGINMCGYKAVPPFDGSEKRLGVANSEYELEELLRSNVVADYTMIHDYIQDLDLTVIKDLIC